VRLSPLAGLVGSIALHVGVVALVTFIVRPAPAQPAADEAMFPIELTDLGPIPPRGVETGQLGATGPLDAAPALPTPDRTRPAPTATAADPVKRAAADPDQPADPSKPAQKADEKPADADKEKEREAMRDAVRKAMLSPDYVPTSATGSATAAAPLGVPSGTPGGTGGGKPKVSAQYAGILDGWFSSRVALGGLDIPWEELKTLRVTVTISLTPDRHVTGFSIVSGSGNGAYDARVRSSMQAVVGSGASLPAPTDDSPVPPQITLVFQCRTQARCSLSRPREPSLSGVSVVTVLCLCPVSKEPRP
jgi:outer membrane biosynthesis protein TonB